MIQISYVLLHLNMPRDCMKSCKMSSRIGSTVRGWLNIFFHIQKTYIVINKKNIYLSALWFKYGNTSSCSFWQGFVHSIYPNCTFLQKHREHILCTMLGNMSINYRWVGFMIRRYFVARFCWIWTRVYQISSYLSPALNVLIHVYSCVNFIFWQTKCNQTVTILQFHYCSSDNHLKIHTVKKKAVHFNLQNVQFASLFVCQISKLSWSILHYSVSTRLALSDDCNSIKRALPTDLFGWQIFSLEGFGSLIELICNEKWKCIDFWHQYSLFPEVRLNLDVLWCIPTMHSTQCPYNWDFDGLDSK